MAQTPEGKVKDMVKDLLLEFGLIPAGKAAKATNQNTGKYHMPVSNGMGVTGLPDFYGHFRGYFFEIETKAPGKVPTPLQQHQLNATTRTGGRAFVVDGEASLEKVADWLKLVNLTRT